MMDKTCKPAVKQAQTMPVLRGVAITHQADAKKQRFHHE